MNSKSLSDYKENTFSQFGEDGILREILRRINVSSGVCVEFGAWDGVLLSNTAALWTSTKKWKGVLIESDSSKFEILKRVCTDYDALPIIEFITPTGKTSIEEVLKTNNIRLQDVQVLSIDIDGNEYQILEHIHELHPSVLIVEYNPTIPPELSIVAKEDTFFGSSARAISELATRKGYTLVAMTKTNCIFVASTLSVHFNDINTTFETMFDRSCLTYLITGYDGSYAFSKRPAYGMTLPLDPKKIDTGEVFIFNHSHARTRWNYAKDRIKKIARRILTPKNIFTIRYYTSYGKWLIAGSSEHPHMEHKRKILRTYAKKYNTRIFIETGTAGGETVRSLKNYFDTLYTIELDPTIYHQGKSTSTEDTITFLQGDSGIVLKELLTKITKPALFWLDAHYSGGSTGRGVLDTPILQELSHIFNHPCKNHVVIIDDVKDFNGTNSYPTIEELRIFVKQNAPRYTTEIKDGTIILTVK